MQSIYLSIYSEIGLNGNGISSEVNLVINLASRLKYIPQNADYYQGHALFYFIPCMIYIRFLYNLNQIKGNLKIWEHEFDFDISSFLVTLQ